MATQMATQMAKCDMCVDSCDYSPMNCYTESGECVDPLTNYDIVDNRYILKPNHNKPFYVFCHRCPQKHTQFTLKYVFQLKEMHKMINEQILSKLEQKIETMLTEKLNEKLNEKIFESHNLNELFQLKETMKENEQIISKLKEKIETMLTEKLNEKLNEKIFESHNLNELFKLINNTNETIKKDNSLIHKIIMNKEEQMERKHKKINEKIYKVATFIQLSNLMNCLLVILIYYYS